MEKSVHGSFRLNNRLIIILLCLSYSIVRSDCTTSIDYVSALGDPGMKNDSLRVAIEAWNQCNEVGEEAKNMGSPRMADCFDLNYSSFPVKIIHKVDEKDNRLGVQNGTYGGIKAGESADLYAAQKEIYLGNKCEVMDNPNPWQFWMIMLKNGNTDTLAAICPENGKKAKPFPPTGRFPCFGKGCMNMPSMHHEYTSFVDQEGHLSGSFYGTWDLDSDEEDDSVVGNNSYYKVKWEKKIGGNESWVFHHLLKTSSKYPWLMLYLRADAIRGFSGGYHYDTRGMMKMTLKSPNFKVRFKLDILKGGGSGSQFYLMDMGSCWKNDGRECDGDVTTDVTRYSEMIINPESTAVCSRNRLNACPPYHTFPNGTEVHRTDKERFPYEAYHYYCVPGNARFAETPYEVCDPYSNPQPQEILQILPHPVWEEFGYPTKKGQGWIGDPRTWELDVGKLSQSLYFYQDLGTKPVARHWSSIDLGTEIYMSKNQIAEWTDFELRRRICGCYEYITQEKFEKMWCWLFPVASAISRGLINGMWRSNSPKWIEGFVTKEEVEHSLQSQEPGTFVLRLPTSRSWPHPDAGSLVVTYVGHDFVIHHRLLSIDHIYDSSERYTGCKMFFWRNLSCIGLEGS